MAHQPDYRLLGLAGQGQFAQVYCAIHRRTGKLVAIKQTRHASEQSSQEPFVLHGLSHPNVMGCQAIRQVDDGYQFILDYCEGGTLRSHLDTAGPLPLSESKSLLQDILEGLAYIHHHQIIHGDLKPENILLTHVPAGRICADSPSVGNTLTARIGDLGSARFVELPNRSRREIGSPTYAAPERFEGRSSFASDLYAVGVMLYELLLGDRPFSGTPAVLRHAHQTQPIPLPDTLSQPAMQLLLTALQKQPQKRFPSASAMLAAIQQVSAVYLPELGPPVVLPRVSDSIPPPATAAQRLDNDSVSVASALSAIPLDSTLDSTLDSPLAGPLESVESLVTTPQGCCVITARSLHLLTPQKQLLPIAQFDQPCWSVVSPNGQWFITLPKQPQRKSQGRLYTLSASGFQGLRAAQRHPIVLTSPLLTALSSDIVQVLAIDTRHLLRVRIVQHAEASEKTEKTGKTYLECFTRRGQFVGQVSLNLSIIHLTPTALPYQFVGLTAETDTLAPAGVILVTLKPFQVRHLRFQTHPFFERPQQVSAFSWGCVITSESGALVLDRFAEPMASLTGLPSARAIAAMGDRQLLLAVDRDLAVQKSPITDRPVDRPSVTGLSLLVLADLSKIDLGLIF